MEVYTRQLTFCLTSGLFLSKQANPANISVNPHACLVLVSPLGPARPSPACDDQRIPSDCACACACTAGCSESLSSRGVDLSSGI
eukprot:1330844-Amorphochlora_amoeboformis.AAC.1